MTPRRDPDRATTGSGQVAHLNPVFVVTGDEDPLYCLEAYGSCDDILRGGAILFPRALRLLCCGQDRARDEVAGLGAGYPRGCAQLVWMAR